MTSRRKKGAKKAKPIPRAKPRRNKKPRRDGTFHGAIPEELRETFRQLQRLEQGKFQALGDELLPSSFPELTGLKSSGLTPEGKTRKDVVPRHFTIRAARGGSMAAAMLEDVA